MTRSLFRQIVTGAGLAGLASLLPLGAAEAYVGPGLGAGAVAVVLGVIGSVFLAVFAIVWYPLKRLLKKHRASAQDSGAKG